MKASLLWYIKYCLERKKAVGEFFRINPFKVIHLLNRSKEFKIILSLTWGGGAELYLNKLIPNFSPECIALIVVPTGKVGVLSVKAINKGKKIIEFNISSLLTLRVVTGRCREIIINHLIGWNIYYSRDKISAATYALVVNSVMDMKKWLDAQMIFMVHDYFSVCPRFTLTNEDGAYCDSEYAKKHCSVCLKSQRNRILDYSDNMRPYEWRSNFARLFDECDEVRTFSEDSYARIKKLYPKAKLTMIPHEPLNQFSKLSAITKDVLTIGVIGNLSAAKGAWHVLNLARYLDSIGECTVKIIVIGKIDLTEEYTCPDRIEIHGRYDNSNLPELVINNKINVVFFPSVWPETFSFVTQEIMQLGLPIACFDFGAPRDRVRQYEKGMVIPEVSPQSTWMTILKLAKKEGIIA